MLLFLMLDIARNNMKRLNLKAECICANAAVFTRYSEYDVFYFYNPFGRPVFEKAGFVLKNEMRDRMRGTTTKYYCYS